ncbi:glycoside hydrolase superfamily [Coemansia spiralis]|nr:glycoside hydrolase superfamily [Coemansia spiralis]
MRRVGVTFLAALAAASIIGVAANPVPDSNTYSAVKPTKCIVNRGQPNPTPFVIPSLQEWNGGKGKWNLSQSTRIVVDPAYISGGSHDASNTFMANPSGLKQFADVFQNDIKIATGFDIEVVVSDKHSKNDIFLTLGADTSDPALNNEGYLLDIGNNGISIQAVTSRGAFWGTRSLLQMLILADEDGYALPQGHARDFPNYNERKFMQDIARKPIPMSDLKEYATVTSFYKFNTLHQHYNDNPGLQTKQLMPDWATKYAGFRLKSDNPTYSKYASTDLAYTKQDLRDFQDFVKARGMDLIPEIDTPAHSLCFTKFHPDWTIESNDARGDWMDLGNQEVTSFVEGLWTEFVGWFDSSEISIGADEYDPTKGDLARKYVNHFHDYFAANFNRTVRMWGSDVRLPGTIDINHNIHTDHWDWTYSNPVDLVKRGHKVSNLNAPDSYLVPRSQSYWDYIDDRKMYELWEPWVFDILDKTNKSRNLDPNEPLLTGGGLANWNDFLSESVTRVELYDRVSRAVGAIGEKLWSGSKNSDKISYDKWAPLAKKLRENIPGITLTHRPKSKSQFVISYDFEDGAAKDDSGNGYDGELHNGAQVVDAGAGHGKAVQLSANSYVSTPLESIRYPYALGMWIKPSGNQSAEAVILESGDGKLLISNSTAPTVTFEQDGNQYDTQIILPPNEWSHIAFSADGVKTSVFFNMRRQAIVNYYNNRWDMLRNETMVVTGPIRNIGSKNGNSMVGLVDGFFVLDRASYGGEMAFLGKHYANALP